MTLHWWMHWFWVTTLLTVILSSEGSHAAPQADTPKSENATESRQSERQGRAMYFAKTTTPSTAKLPSNDTNSTQTVEAASEIDQKPNITLSLNQSDTKNVTEIVHPAFHKPESNTTIEAITNHTLASVSNETEAHNATVPPPNKKRHNLTRHPEVKEIGNEGVAESRIVTERPLSLETTFLQTRIPPNIESSRRIIDQPEGPYNGSGMDTGEIAGISFAALVLVALAGSTAFVIYRRRYLNKPQTLNDKCSNPDSSGYLDDSTIRDNSEEMYSLDNDSFLNSLEAMTIQNYWTDTVKHTKL